MSRKIFITGTGTDIGKTYISGLIAKKLNENGENTAYYKAAMSGNIRDNEGKLIPGDAVFVKEISKIQQPAEEMCPYVYEHAYSPHLASRIEKNLIEFDLVEKGFYQVCQKYDYIIMEGSGGIMCPLRTDGCKIQLEDVIKKLGLSTIIIADAGLGTINNLVLTSEYMKNRNISIEGVIYNNYHPGNILDEDNIIMCEKMTGLKTLAKVKKGDKNLKIDIKELKKIFK